MLHGSCFGINDNRWILHSNNTSILRFRCFPGHFRCPLEPSRVLSWPRYQALQSWKIRKRFACKMLNSPHDERKLSSRNLNFDHRRLCLNSLKKLTFKQAWLRCVALLHRNFFGDRGGGWECKPRRFSFSTNRIRQLVPSFICWPRGAYGRILSRLSLEILLRTEKLHTSEKP